MKNIRIDIGNSDSYIHGHLFPKAYERLRQELSYKVLNCEFSEAYNTINPKTGERKWDGRMRLVWKMKNKIKFPTGLLSKVRVVLDDFDIEYEISDSRPPKPKKTMNLTFADGIELRDYQKDAVDKSCSIGRGIIKAATGAGKTISAAGIIQKKKVNNVIFMAMSGDLILQAKKEFEKFLRLNGEEFEVGIVGTGLCDIKDINVATVQTICKAFDIDYSKMEGDDEDERDDGEVAMDRKEAIRNMVYNANMIIFDEVQHAACDTVKLIMDKAKGCRYRFGLSVFPESFVEMKGNVFGDGRSLAIEDAWSFLEKDNFVQYEDGYELINLNSSGVFSRGWQDDNFCWKNVKNIIRHKNDKKSYSIRFAGKDSVKMTEDHSLFRIVNGEIQECKPSELSCGDMIILDNGTSWEGKSFDFTILDVLSDSPDNFRVGIDLSNVNREDIEKNSKQFWQLTKRGSVAKEFGGSLSFSEYLQFKNILPRPEWIYTEGASGVGVSADLRIDDIAYLYGFYLGDGWISGNRISFAVENDLEKEFLSKAFSEKIRVNFDIRNLQGCGQIRVSCKPLAKFFESLFGNESCYNKKISDKIIFSEERIRREVLRGLIDSDGSDSRTLEDLARNRRPIRYTTTSELLKNNVCTLLRSLNVQYTVSERPPANGGVIDGRQIVGKKVSWQVIFSQNALNGINEKRKGNVKRTCINCIEKDVLEVREISSNDGYVYDLEMDGHPSFVANGVLVHNSASPWRDDNADLFIDSQFGRRIVDISASKLIKEGYLVKPYIKMVRLITDRCSFNTYAAIYKNFIVENERRNNLIERFAKRHADNGDYVLILVKQIKHGKLLEKQIEGSAFISGKMSAKKREKMLDELREGKIKIAIATSVFDEGVDVKRLNCLIMGGSGKSSTRALQRIGRVIRPFKEGDWTKKFATIYDFMDSAKYISSHSKARVKIYKTEEEFDIKVVNVGEA
jgi:superfamily II DNA or RNA helicase/intein/homing endonuclease